MNQRYISIKLLATYILLQSAAALLAQEKKNNTDTIAIPRSLSKEIEPARLFNNNRMYSTAAVSFVNGETLYKTTTPNLTNTLYGRLAGLTVTQGSGEPGNDEALLGIRGIGSYGFTGGAGGYSAYKIFVDGFETNRNYLRNLSPAEIESVAVLKDAAALATFGMRGANGVLYITTKRGKIGKPTVQVQARTGIQQTININKPLNAYDYARLYNQAISNDNGGTWKPKFSDAQLQAYQSGTGNVDWYDQVLKNSGAYTDADLVFNGGDSTARYNVVLNYANQNGLYNVKNTDSTSNQYFRRYNIRTNLDFRMFKIFEAKVDLGGRIEQRRMPNYVNVTGDGNRSTGALWNDLARYPSNVYPVKDPTGNWSGTTLFPNNPSASINDLGWVSTNGRILQGNFELKEKLDFITPGLYMSQAFSFNSFTLSGYSKTATYARFYEGAKTTTDNTTPIRAGSQFPAGQEDWKQGTATIGYDKKSGNHQLISAVNYHQSDFRGDGFYSLVYHYQNISGRANYTYQNKYIAELGFSYFGTDAYAPGNRWGFYPAVSAAWILSNESFLQNSTVFNFAKLRASVGKTGSADSESGSPSGQNGRYLYQQYYQAGSPIGSFFMGNGTPAGQGVLTPLYIANPDIFAEQSIKYNIGAELNLFKKLELSVDLFMDKRSDIITRDNSIPGSFGNIIVIKNLGKQTNKGFEVSALFSDKVGKFTYALSGMAMYNSNTIDYMAEVAPAYSYNAQTGRAFGTPIGLVATGYYQLNDFNADGSLKSGQAVPSFGAVQAGDLKYQDLNGDNKVDQNDVTAIGKPSFPQLTYSFGGNVGYGGFDLDFFFQGISNSTVNILNNSSQVQAFVNNGNAYDIAKGAWAYYPDQNIDTRASATYPRLTTTGNNNNYRNSSFWIKNRDFLRLRNVALGYSLSSRLLHKLRVSKLRIYVNAVNPVTWSSLLDDYNMDPETISGYPAMKSWNTGFSITF